MLFDNFTQNANRAIAYTIDAAKQLGHQFVGTEHLLLGLLQTEGSTAEKLLTAAGITDKTILEKIMDESGTSMPTELSINNITPRLARIFRLAIYQASRSGSAQAGTEHILMALIKEGNSKAMEYLTALNCDVEGIYNTLLEGMGTGSGNRAAFNENMNNVGIGAQSIKGNTSTPTLDSFGRDLTKMAADGKIDPVIGRSKEIERVIQILSRRTKNNPCLIGEPGVGKTAIAEGLAQHINAGTVPEPLKGKRVVTLDIAGMLAGAKYRGDFEERLKNALKEVTDAGNILLFIDEIHILVGAGAAEGAVDAANILKPSLARGELQVIGATTINEYRKNIEKDAALERRFQPVMVDEPSVEDSVRILQGIREKYENHHHIKITDEAIEAAVKLSKRYIQDRFLPDKAIDLMDEAASRLRISNLTAPPDLTKKEDELKAAAEKKQNAVKNQEYEEAAKYRDEEKKIKSEIEEIRKQWSSESSSEQLILTAEGIAEILAASTGIPVKQLAEEESERLLNLEKILHERVIGQDNAVTTVAKAVRRSRVGLKDPKRPMGSFLFLGPTGVGKTELSKALAEVLFGDENAMIRIDMSEYMEKHTVAKLIGSPPGYVGYDEGGQLTEKIRRKPYSVVLFDEIEKAHPDVFNIMLQILDDGLLTDSQGRHVDFKNTVIIMTSNVGAKNIVEPKSVGFTTRENNFEDAQKVIKSNVTDSLKETFRPEFLNRIDDIIVFDQLKKEDIVKIADNMLKSIKARLSDMEITLNVTPEAAALLADKGFDVVYGARPLRRTIQNFVEDAVAEKILDGSVKKGETVNVDAKDGEIVIESANK